MYICIHTHITKYINRNIDDVVEIVADKSILDQAIEDIDFFGDFPEVNSLQNNHIIHKLELARKMKVVVSVIKAAYLIACYQT